MAYEEAKTGVRPRAADGGGEGTKATTDEGAERSVQEFTVNEEVRAQDNENGIPKDACG